MEFKQPMSLPEVANLIGAQIIGNHNLVITGANEIHKVSKGDVTFVDIPKYIQRSLHSEASVVIMKDEKEPPTGKAILLHPNPFLAYEKIIQLHYQQEYLSTHIHSTAEIHPTAHIEPFVTIGAYAKIGRRSIIQSNSYIGSHTQIGDDVLIQPNCTIGSDAFYYKRAYDSHIKWTTCGKVIIENQVDIGAGCTIDKGVSGDTIIGRNTKFDNLIHIGHGAVIGENCLFAAQVGIGGKTIIGNNVTLYGQVGIAQNLVIGEHVVVLAQSGVSKNLDSHKSYFGYPAQEASLAYRELAMIRKMTKEEQDVQK